MAAAEHSADPRKVGRDDVEARLKIKGIWAAAEEELAADAVAAQAAAREGLAVSDAELQEAFDDFRRSLGLHKADDTNRWLREQGLRTEQVEAYVEALVVADKLAASRVDDRQVESFYAQNPARFEYARVSRIVVADQGAANELALSLREEGEDFARLARSHSLDLETRIGGGFVGLITRDDTGGLPQADADRLFAAKAGEVVGPIRLENNYCLVRVEETGRRELDDGLRADIRAALYRQWLAEQMSK